MRVVVTRPAADAAEWVDALRAHGFDAVSLPLIDIRPVGDATTLQDAWRRIAGYRAVMFVSANAVRAFFSAKPQGAVFASRAWSTGAGTRKALVAAGVPESSVDSPPADAAQFDSEALWAVVQPQCRAGDRVLLVRGGEGRDWLEQRLVESGAGVDVAIAYERAAPVWNASLTQLALGAARDAWLFSSSEAVGNLRNALPAADWSGARAIATHPRIAQAARAAGFRVVCESRPAVADVIAALESLG